MDITFITFANGSALYAYVDTLPRGFGFNTGEGYSVLRLGRLVIEWGA